jgi:hypothetical protein
MLKDDVKSNINWCWKLTQQDHDALLRYHLMTKSTQHTQCTC